MIEHMISEWFSFLRTIIGLLSPLILLGGAGMVCVVLLHFTGAFKGKESESDDA